MSKMTKNDTNLIKYIVNKVIEFTRLEFHTKAGKYNFLGTILLGVFILIYTANTTICYIVSAVENCVKSIVLNQDIYHPYESPNVLKVILPLIILMSICFMYLIKYEDIKDTINNSD